MTQGMCKVRVQGAHDVPLACAVLSFTLASSSASAERLSENVRCACCPEAPADGGRRSCCACACMPERCLNLMFDGHERLHQRIRPGAGAGRHNQKEDSVVQQLCSGHVAPTYSVSEQALAEQERSARVKQTVGNSKAHAGGYLAAAGVSG